MAVQNVSDRSNSDFLNLSFANNLAQFERVSTFNTLKVTTLTPPVMKIFSISSIDIAASSYIDIVLSVLMIFLCTSINLIFSSWSL